MTNEDSVNTIVTLADIDAAQERIDAAESSTDTTEEE